MNTALKRIKLTDKDKKTIVKNSNICTESHGKGCSGPVLNELNKKLN